VFVVFLVFVAIASVGVWFIVKQAIALYEAAFGENGFMLHLPQEAAEFVRDKVSPVVPGKDWLVKRLTEMQVKEGLVNAITTSRSLIEAGAAWFGTLFSMVSFAILFPIYLYYFMLDLPAIWDWIKTHLPGRHRDRIVAVCARIHDGMSAFLRGRIVIAVLKGFLTAAGLAIIGIPYAFLIGMLAGILSILPFVGAALGLVASLVLVIVSGTGVGALIGVIVVFVVAEIVEGYVLYPLILSDKLDMHPATMLFSVLAWGAILGAFGVLVAIPLTIVVRAVAAELLLRPLEKLADETR
jgi:predicted PurR-regulated permease PerM